MTTLDLEILSAARTAGPDERPVVISALGPFEIVKDGHPLRFVGKTPRKPLALLKLLIALGARDVPECRLTEILWPDSDGDTASQAFATTLHRLRRLLGHAGAIRRSAGHVSLDPRYCWLDTWAVETLLRRAEARGMAAAGDAAGWADIVACVDAAVALFRGPFLGGDPEYAVAAFRIDRLRQRLLRRLGDVARYREQTGDWARAVECYETALEIDDCAEEPCRRLMTLYDRLGMRREALGAYHRCSTTLAAHYGLLPSLQTQAVYTVIASR